MSVDSWDEKMKQLEIANNEKEVISKTMVLMASKPVLYQKNHLSCWICNLPAKYRRYKATRENASQKILVPEGCNHPIHLGCISRLVYHLHSRFGNMLRGVTCTGGCQVSSLKLYNIRFYLVKNEYYQKGPQIFGISRILMFAKQIYPDFCAFEDNKITHGVKFDFKTMREKALKLPSPLFYLPKKNT